MEKEFTNDEKISFLMCFLDEEEKVELKYYARQIDIILDMALERAENALRNL